eukprot:gene172-61_t
MTPVSDVCLFGALQSAHGALTVSGLIRLAAPALGNHCPIYIDDITLRTRPRRAGADPIAKRDQETTKTNAPPLAKTPAAKDDLNKSACKDKSAKADRTRTGGLWFLFSASGGEVLEVREVAHNEEHNAADSPKMRGG